MKKSFTINIIKIYVLILYLTLINIELKAQLNVDISYTPLDLVQNILVSQGVTVTNVQFTGNNSQKAYFSGNTNIGFTDGILLTTGGATVAIGPNNSGSAQVSVNTPGDADLEALVNYTTFDASA
ncbi:MAG TPA: choice-of-anchor L domain-containing protein, partial [Bacteroidales bacterium]|nr:choice-of-anchor L domain-containing protein [Bacteroidales bacterium]